MRMRIAGIGLLLASVTAIAAEGPFYGGRNGIIEAAGLGGTATGDIDLDGTYKLILDADGNTHVKATTDDTYQLTIGGTVRVTGTTSALTSTIPILNAAGSASAPGYSYSTDPDTGSYLSNPNEVSIATQGVQRLKVSTTAATATVPILIPDGDATNPGIAFSSATNTGLYTSSSQLRIDVAGTARASVSTTAVTVASGVKLIASTAGTIITKAVGTTVTEPHTCDSTNEGAIVFADDTNDGAGSVLCYCGKIANDSTYDWLLTTSTAATPVACPLM